MKQQEGNTIEIDIIVRNRGANGKPVGDAGRATLTVPNNYAGATERKKLANEVRSAAEAVLDDQ